MTLSNFKKWNLILGWITFGIALLTYGLTIEPTVSAWDVGEYIATSIKLEVGHPPGAPLFQMLGAFFAMFTSDVTEIAKMVNFMSALASAFTILFMFWTITRLSKKLVTKEDLLSSGTQIAILGAGVVGSLAYTFSDSFWFSAVEAEVYAMSSLFTALVFWAILKWENVADEPGHLRWILVIAYLMGLSIGVHLLNLLAIPAIALVYYFKKYEFSWKGLAITTVVAGAILGFVQEGLIKG